jgi:hypothetical protein
LLSISYKALDLLQEYPPIVIKDKDIRPISPLFSVEAIPQFKTVALRPVLDERASVQSPETT